MQESGEIKDTWKTEEKDLMKTENVPVIVVIMTTADRMITNDLGTDVTDIVMIDTDVMIEITTETEIETGNVKEKETITEIHNVVEKIEIWEGDTEKLKIKMIDRVTLKRRINSKKRLSTVYFHFF